MFTLPGSPLKRGALLLLAVFYTIAGLGHFVRPEFYLSIMPPWMPAPLALVYISGVFEILGGLGVLPVATRRWAGYGLAALLVAVLPANIHMAVNPDSFAQLAPKWGLYLRLPLQMLLIAWALWATSPDKDRPTAG